MAVTGPEAALHDALADVLARFYARSDELGHDVAAAFVAVITPKGFDAPGWWSRWCAALHETDLIRHGQGVDRWSQGLDTSGVNPFDGARVRQAFAEHLVADHLAGVFRELLDVVTTQELGARVALWAPTEEGVPL